MKPATKVTSTITRTVGIAMAYFLGRKKSCTGCDVSTNGCVEEAHTAAERSGAHAEAKRNYKVPSTSSRQRNKHGCRKL